MVKKKAQKLHPSLLEEGTEKVEIARRRQLSLNKKKGKLNKKWKTGGKGGTKMKIRSDKRL